jgi:hypothetical protein
VKRQEQAKVVRSVEARLRELIAEHQRKEKRWPRAHDRLLKEFHHRLGRVE